MESYVRGMSYKAMLRENRKVNRALTGAALSLGANVEIIDNPGYAPLNNDMSMMELAKEAFELAFPTITLHYDPAEYSKGSTDMGDLSCIMPVVHPYAAGATGISHGSNYMITDPTAACVNSAKWQLAMLYLLLKDNAEYGNKVVKEFKPTFASKEEFINYIDTFEMSGERITYNEDGTANIILK